MRMHQNHAEPLSQHDLTRLNFHAIEAPLATDFIRTLDESRVIEALKSISPHFDSGQTGYLSAFPACLDSCTPVSSSSVPGYG